MPTRYKDYNWFGQHIDVDYEPSDELLAARQESERAESAYDDAVSQQEDGVRLEPDSEGWDAIILQRQARWDACLAAEAALESIEDRNNWWLLPLAISRDTTEPQESNFYVALEILGGESDTVEVHRFGNPLNGWTEHILVHPSREKEVADIEARLEDHPLLDEEDHSRRESEQMDEDWNNWGEWQFRKDVMRAMETIVNDLDVPETELEKANRLLYADAFDEDGIRYDVTGKEPPPPGEAERLRMEFIDANWTTEHWTALFVACNGDRSHTGSETIFNYDAQWCAECALECDPVLETKEE